MIMIAQYIQLGNRGWNILVYYNVDSYDFLEVRDSLLQLECSEQDISKMFNLLKHKNTGFTFTNTWYKMSIICISSATDVSQFVSTAIHEAKHVQSHICEYYGVDEDSETAAYLIGYIARRMYMMLSKFIKAYV